MSADPHQPAQPRQPTQSTQPTQSRRSQRIQRASGTQGRRPPGRRTAPDSGAWRRAPRGSGALAALAVGAALAATVLALAVPAGADEPRAGEARPSTAPAATPTERAEAALAALRDLAAKRAAAEASLAAAPRDPAEPERRGPEELAALAQLSAIEEAIAEALAVLDGAAAHPAARGLVVAAVEADPRAALVDQVGPLVARRCGERGGGALAAVVAARGREPGIAVLLALAAAEGPRAAAARWAIVEDARRTRSDRHALVERMVLAAEAGPRLAALLADPAPEIASAAAARLRALDLRDGGEHAFVTLESLRATLRGAPRDRRLLAVGALAGLPVGLALGELELLLGDPDDGVAAAAVASLGRLDDPFAAAILVREAKSPYRQLAVRRAALGELGRRRERAALDDLIELCRDPDVADHAARALRSITGKAYGPSHAMWATWRERERRDAAAPATR